MPEAVGVPLIVIILEAQEAVTPPGSPVAAPMPVARVVVWVMAVRSVFTHSVGVEEAAPAVFTAVTVMVPVAVPPPDPPVSGML